jgi:ABC-type antimicrobial peptide transport system permease subunit
VPVSENFFHVLGVEPQAGFARKCASVHQFEKLRLAAIGLIIGLAGSVILTRSLASLLFGVNSYDPASFTATVIVLVVVATVAGYLPARRASQIDPIQALRAN